MKPLRNAFTMVELLVVVAVIALTVGVFLPAMQRVRAEANRVACQNNLKLLGLALHNYECSYSQFPPACRVKVGITSDLWSVPARLLRYVEQTDLSAQIDFESSYQHQPRITEIRLKMLTCPSEVKARPYTSDGLTYYASSYGINYGTWFIFNPATQAAGDGAFCVNQALKSSDIRDGLSNTLAMAEVKAHQPLIHDGGSPQETVPRPPTLQNLAWTTAGHSTARWDIRNGSTACSDKRE